MKNYYFCCALFEMKSIHVIFGICIFQDLVKIENMKTLEKKVSYGRGRGGQSKSCIKVKKNVPNSELEKCLKSRGEDTPRLVIFVDGEKIEMINIVGDGVVVEIDNKSVEYSFVVLTASYYVYDLAFPREFEQFLEFIKHWVFEDEDRKKKKMAGFIEMLHKMSQVVCVKN